MSCKYLTEERKKKNENARNFAKKKKKVTSRRIESSLVDPGSVDIKSLGALL
jgi:hypothetical protein